MSAEMRVFWSGAKSSEEKPRYDLIPACSLRRQAVRMAHGAASHGERNYETGWNDADFLRDRQNHLFEHITKYINGDRSDDHLGAILANAGMLARLEELFEERREADKQIVANYMPTNYGH